MKKLVSISLAILLSMSLTDVFAQYGEPPVRSIEEPKNLYDEGYKTGLGFHFGLSDFGFGTGVQLRKGLSPYTEGLVNLGISGLRDPSEQTYIDYFVGSRTIPSKYKRVITFPMSIGLKRRLFARQITDNFRVYTSMSFGPSFAMTTPYFDDENGNMYRESDIRYSDYEEVRDIFQGLKDTEWHFGWNGDLTMGIDFGENFARLQTFQFGYSFFYFREGLQILEPYKPVRNNLGQIIDPNGNGVLELDPNGDGNFDDSELRPANDPTDYFGSAKITFIFGWMW
jgi:hypothetical protein